MAHKYIDHIFDTIQLCPLVTTNCGNPQMWLVSLWFKFVLCLLFSTNCGGLRSKNKVFFCFQLARSLKENNTFVMKHSKNYNNIIIMLKLIHNASIVPMINPRTAYRITGALLKYIYNYYEWAAWGEVEVSMSSKVLWHKVTQGVLGIFCIFKWYLFFNFTSVYWPDTAFYIKKHKLFYYQISG